MLRSMAYLGINRNLALVHYKRPVIKRVAVPCIDSPALHSEHLLNLKSFTLQPGINSRQSKNAKSHPFICREPASPHKILG